MRFTLFPYPHVTAINSAWPVILFGSLRMLMSNMDTMRIIFQHDIFCKPLLFLRKCLEEVDFGRFWENKNTPRVWMQLCQTEPATCCVGGSQAGREIKWLPRCRLPTHCQLQPLCSAKRWLGGFFVHTFVPMLPSGYTTENAVGVSHHTHTVVSNCTSQMTM